MRRRIAEARMFALMAHGKQKYGKLPYIYHCDMVYNILKLVGVYDDDILIAAYLHDVIEDTNNNEATIELEFNYNIAKIVKAVSNVESFEKTYINISDLYSACIVKIADRIANLMMSTSTKNIKMINKYLDQHSLFMDCVYSNVHYIELKNRYIELIELAKSIIRDMEN